MYGKITYSFKVHVPNVTYKIDLHVPHLTDECLQEMGAIYVCVTCNISLEILARSLKAFVEAEGEEWSHSRGLRFHF